MKPVKHSVRKSEPPDLDTLIRSCALFADLTAEMRGEVAALCRQIFFPREAEIFAEDSDGSEIYVVPEGRVAIEIQLGGTGIREQISMIKDHEVFGELSLLDGFRRSARAIALDDLYLYVLRREELVALMKRRPDLGMALMTNLARILARRLRDTNLSLRNALMQQKFLLNDLQ